jgi:hypothetical protein
MLINKKIKEVIALVTATITFLIIGFWSYWGINENFHEGWYSLSLWENLSLAFIQYLSIPIIFLVISLIAINYKKIGTGLFIVFSIFAMFFFKSNSGRILIFIPLLLFALGFYFGKFKSKKIITISFISIFFLIILSFGIPQLIKVENRFNDYDFGLRIVEGNNIELTWAPLGVGYPLKGTNWQTAKSNCARLSNNGTILLDNEINIWRLPSRQEIVASLTRKNNNSMGFIDEFGVAQYKIKPDKETPLWNPHSQVIYYWTNESKNQEQAFLVAYNGYILGRNKNFGLDYQGYRCVKE